MNVGVLSDSHDRLPCIRAALDAFARAGVGAVLHAGDVIAPFAARLLAPPALPRGLSVHCVYGNNDGERAGLAKVLPQIRPGPLRIELGGRIVVLAHCLEDLPADAAAGADVLVTGHTHQVVNETRRGVLHLNPGEACGWVHGRCTAAILDTERLSAEIIELRAEAGHV